MLNKYRAAITILCVGFIVLCHAAYLWATKEGRPTEFAQRMSEQPIQILSLVILVVIVLLGFLPTKEDEVGS